VSNEYYRLSDTIHESPYDGRVGCQVTKCGGIEACARKLLDHVDAVTRLLQSLSDFAPIPAADKPAMDENEVGHIEIA